MKGPDRADGSDQGYNAVVAADPEAAVADAAWLEDAFRGHNLTFGGEPMRTFLRPHLLSAAQWGGLRDDGRRLLELAVRVARVSFDGDIGRLFAFLGTPEREARWVRIDPGPPDVLLSRLDAFLTPEGPRFIEINSDAPAGVGYGDRMAEVFAQLPMFVRAFAGRRLRYHATGPALVDAILALWDARGGTPPPSVAIVDWAEVKTRADQEILRDLFERRGMRCALADPRDAVVDGASLRFGDFKTDVVYRRGVLTELAQREDEVRTFLQAYADRRALFVNSFRCRLSEDKAFFAVLTDERFGGLMSPDERAFVARVVPWTRRVEERHTTYDGQDVDLVPLVAAHRERFVLKPAHGYGGQSVHIGDETAAATWEATLQAGLSEPWVVQERVTIPEEVFPAVEKGALVFRPVKVNVNPFYVGGAEVGAVTRASVDSVINVSAGGGSVPTFVVD